MDCAQSKINLCTKDSKPINPNWICLRDYSNDKVVSDTLHKEALKSVKCTSKYCLGSFVNKTKTLLEIITKQEKIKEAADFLNLYFDNLKEKNSTSRQERLNRVVEEIVQTGNYELTKAELLFGFKSVWRNSARCIGRAYYSTLEIVDARHVTTAKEMFDIICEFYRDCTNNGSIKLKALVFSQRKGLFKDFRIWNSQLVNYACYKIDENTYIGDKAQYELTQECEKLGWKGKGTEFDILPLVLQAEGKEPEWFEVPRDIIIEVPILHPKYDFERLNLKWFVTVSVSTLMIEIGGCQFTAAPFTGFYTSPEVARAFCDLDRYNKIEIFGKLMNLDMQNDVYWRDKVFTEVNYSILYSYQKAKCSIIDHHTIAEQFKRFYENEHKVRGGCPTDWIWMVSQPAAHLDVTFHTEMLNYKLKPSAEYQMSGWESKEALDKLKRII